MFASLRDFIDRLERDGDLIRVAAPVSTLLEMTEIQTRLIAADGPAVLFENPVNADDTPLAIPVLVNLFGSVRRVALGMGRGADDLTALGESLAFLRQPEPPGGWREAMEMLPLLKTVRAMKPKTVSSAPCQEVVWTGDEIDLARLPIQTCWPGEPAPLITWPLVVTADPESGHVNLGVYRMQVTGRNTTLMRWLAHRGGAIHMDRHTKSAGDGAPAPMPAAVVIGADPATLIGAVAPVPEALSEYQFAGLLRGAKGSLVPCKTIPLQVPADAEIVIEGHVSAIETGIEGPYGDHTGFYNATEPFPVFTVSAITMRHDPIYLSTYTGRPPDEPSVMAEALNDVFVPLLRQQFPEITDFYLPPEACSYRVAVVALRKEYPGHAKRVMMGVWSYLRQFMYTKYIIVIDDTLDARDWKDVIWALSTNTDPARDMTVIEDTPIDYLDFASPVAGLGSKMGIDATTKIPPETSRTWGTPIRMSDEVIRRVDEMWTSLGLPGDGANIWKK